MKLLCVYTSLKTRLSNGIRSILLIMSLTLICVSNALYAQNIAVVDVSVFQEQFINEVNSKLESQFKKRQDELQEKLDSFNKNKEKLQKDTAVMTAKSVEDLKKSLLDQQNEIQMDAQKLEVDIAKIRQDEIQKKLDVLTKVVDKISNDKKYDLVLAKNIALYVDSKYDITDTVYKSYNDTAAAQSKKK